MPSASELKLELFDAFGQKVTEIANGKYVAGTQEFQFDNENRKLASGIYLLRLITEQGEITQRLLMQ